ncbi:MAG: hypothetical protein B6U78_00300 [Candidatus Aenigmarchaeota archaeon ex4484_224]|nr:MAG: hypothetical protein B6U78_00300 [Candidatus Aenigmarchaeota archaeon ex4484_224]
MVNYIEYAIRELLSYGFYDLLVFILGTAFIYVLLKKFDITKSRIIDGIISLSVGFSLLAYKVLYGLSIVTPLTGFFMQIFVFGLIFFFGSLLASIFYPDLMKLLAETMKSRRTLFALVALVLAIAISSSLISVFWTAPLGAPGLGPDPTTVSIIVASIIVIIILMAISATQK